MNQETLRAYARLLLATGVNLQPGQKLMVTCNPAQREFVTVLMEEAYGLGAAYVFPRVVFDDWTRVRLERASAVDLDFVPGWFVPWFRELVDDDWAYLYLDGDENPQTLEGADAERMSRLDRAQRNQRAFFFEAQQKSRFCWCVAAVPTDGWARRVLGGQAIAADLWEVLVPIYGLDEPDPAASWRRRLKILDRRGKVLDGLGIDRLRFTGPDTDLTVGLMTRSRWGGGPDTSARGRVFAPNLPTEEVFTTPDWRRTQGFVKATRPVEVMGAEVEEARFTFREGRVVEFDAAQNRSILGRYLSQDDQANALGEVALVDAASRIFQSGRIFHSILFDENAACHVALGSGYPTTVEGGRDLESEDLMALGCNVSRVHTDFMIGGPEISVDAVTADGRNLRIIEKGTFLIE
jgi:aminopeptidase